MGDLSLSLAHLVIHRLVRLCAFADLAAAWPMALWTLHAGSRRELEMDSSQEQAKLPGWGLGGRVQRTVLQIGAGTLDTGFCIGLAGDGL